MEAVCRMIRTQRIAVIIEEIGKIDRNAVEGAIRRCKTAIKTTLKGEDLV